MKEIANPKFRGGDDCAEPLSVCDKDNDVAGENHHLHSHPHPHHPHVIIILVLICIASS